MATGRSPHRQGPCWGLVGVGVSSRGDGVFGTVPHRQHGAARMRRSQSPSKADVMSDGNSTVDSSMPTAPPLLEGMDAVISASVPSFYHLPPQHGALVSQALHYGVKSPCSPESSFASAAGILTKHISSVTSWKRRRVEGCVSGGSAVVSPFILPAQDPAMCSLASTWPCRQECREDELPAGDVPVAPQLDRTIAGTKGSQTKRRVHLPNATQRPKLDNSGGAPRRILFGFGSQGPLSAMLVGPMPVPQVSDRKLLRSDAVAANLQEALATVQLSQCNDLELRDLDSALATARQRVAHEMLHRTPRQRVAHEMLHRDSAQ